MNPEDKPENTVPPGWTPLTPEHLPAPTFWPAGFALAITFIFWGLVTSWVVLVVGVALFAASLAGWIADIRHERKRPHS
jgi:hypothetical protein